MKVTDIDSGLTQAALKALFSYDSATGIFTRLTAPINGHKVGDIAGFINQSGYVALKINHRAFLAHRLAWLYMTGEWPAADVDHHNLDKADNRWENLRTATRQQNSANRGFNKTNTTGFKGVFRRNRSTNPYAAMIRVNNRLLHIGVFPTAESAHAAYVERATAVHGDFARGRA